jgi:hypothetical protein
LQTNGGGTPGVQTNGNGGSPTQGSGNGSPTPLVLNIGGQQTTVAPTVMAGSQGSPSITAFVLGPGTTITAGGGPITLPGGAVVSAPIATGAVPGSPAPGAPLVITIGGVATTIQPTVITGSQGPLTGFIIGPGSTLLPGGSAIVISGTTFSGSAFAGTTLSLPKASGLTTGSKTASSTSGSSITTTTTGKVGDAIASGIGFTSVPPAATGGASQRGLDMSLWYLGVIFGAVGALAVWL